MKYILSIILLLLALTKAQAQIQGEDGDFFPKAKPGRYVLNTSQQVVRAGNLKVFANNLLVKDETNRTYTFKPDEVCWVRIGPVKFIPMKGFRTKVGFGSTIKTKNVFVEVLDSGKVSLYRHTYEVGYPSSSLTVYILRDAAADSVVTLPTSVYTGKGKRFRAVLEPYLTSRPDLLQLVNKGEVDIKTLPALLHALNTGQPLSVAIQALNAEKLSTSMPAPTPVPASVPTPAPPSHYEIMKQQALAKRAKKAAAADSTKK